MLTAEDLLHLTADEWNRRREEGEKVEPLAGKDLSGADMSGRDLHDVDLREANLCNAQMERINLHYASLQNARLSYANLRFANMPRVNAFYSSMAYADLEHAILINASLRFARMQHANLRNADITNSDITGVVLHGAALSGVTGLPNVREILAGIPRNEKGEFALCKVFLHTFDDRWMTPYQEIPADVTEGTVVKVDYVDLSPTAECGCGLHVATKEWCKKTFAEVAPPMPQSAYVPFEVYTDWVFVPLVGGGKFRCYWYRIGPQLAETCADL